MTKRQQNIIRRMLEGEIFFSSGLSPRMSKSEYRDLCEMGFRIQHVRPRFEHGRYFLMKQFEQDNKILYHKITS